MLQGEKSTTSFGRDHQRASFTIWMASGGIKRAFSLGTTDDLGVRIVEGPVGVHDLQATILYLLGLDHKKFTFRFPRVRLSLDRREPRGGSKTPGPNAWR